MGNKILERDETRGGRGLVNVGPVWGMRWGWRCKTCGGRRRRWVLSDRNDATRPTGKVEDHVITDRLLDEADKLRVVEGYWNEGKRVPTRHGERERVELIKQRLCPSRAGGGMVRKRKKEGCSVTRREE